jgi:hypothetical protein
LRGQTRLTARNRTVSVAADFEASYTKIYDLDASACAALVIRHLAAMASATVA